MQRLSCDVRALPADAWAVDALARLHLAAKRAGLELHLCHASPDLVGLIRFTGIDQVLRLDAEAPRRSP